MEVYAIQHVPFETLGYFGEWCEKNGYDLHMIRLYENDPFPPIENIDLLFVLGGPMGIYDNAKYTWLSPEKKFLKQAISAGVKIVGICLGAQLLADVLGAKVSKNMNKEIGWFPISLTEGGIASGIFKGIPESFMSFHWHGDTFAIPENAIWLAKSEACTNQAFIYKNHVLALQFHLEPTEVNVDVFVKENRNELVDAPFIHKNPNDLPSSTIYDEMHGRLDKLMQNFLN